MRIWLEDLISTLTGKLIVIAVIIVILLGGLFTYKVITKQHEQEAINARIKAEQQVKVPQSVKDEAAEQNYQVPGDAANKMIESYTGTQKTPNKVYKAPSCPKGYVQVMENGKPVNVKVSDIDKIKATKAHVEKDNTPASSIFDTKQGVNVVQEGIDSQNGQANVTNMPY